MILDRPHLIWQRIRDEVRRQPPRTFVRFSKRDVPHPKEAGAVQSLGVPRGQLTDFRFRPGHDCRGLHVQEFGTYWEAHLDAVHPACDLLDHLRVDAPGAWLGASAVVGALVGAVLGGSKAAALTGAGIGALLAAISAGSPEDKPGERKGHRRPRAQYGD